mgnify:CR=1 FL=1
MARVCSIESSAVNVLLRQQHDRQSRILAISMTHSQRAYRRPPGPDQPVTLGIDQQTLTTLERLPARELQVILSILMENDRDTVVATLSEVIPVVSHPVLNEIMPENELWINADEAAKLEISDGDRVQVTSSDGSHSGTIKAFVTEFIHPESVFMVHGFGRKVPWQTRGYNKGLGDYRFETGLLDVYDPVGGAIALMECFVKVEKVS